MTNYVPIEIWTVYDAIGKKVADCGLERDAKWLAEVRRGTYRKNNVNISGPVIDVEVQKVLPISNVVITSEPEKEHTQDPHQLETFTFRLPESLWEAVDLR
jgi:hypothetical protein